MRLCLRGGVASGSPESRRAGFVDTRLLRRRGLLAVMGEGVLSFLFLVLAFLADAGSMCTIGYRDAGSDLLREGPMILLYLRVRGRTGS